MKKTQNNYAFIDSQNLHLGIRSLGWKLDYRRFRIYLQEKYGVLQAYMFMGYVDDYRNLYTSLQSAGFVLIFKPVVRDGKGNIKGNVDADLVLRAMIDFNEYDKAILVTSDGDFYCLVDYLYGEDKLEAVMSPYLDTCSSLLKRSAKGKLVFMNTLRRILEYK